MRTLFLLTTLLFIIPNMFGQKEYRLNSPDGKLEVTLYIGDRITYELTEEGHTLVAPSPLSVHLDNGTVWGNGSHLKRVSHRQANEVIPSPFYKRSEVKDVYNEMTLSFREHFNLIFRMYNEGMAYRFAATGNRPFKVTNEEAAFNFNKDYKSIVPYVKDGDKQPIEAQFSNSFEVCKHYSEMGIKGFKIDFMDRDDQEMVDFHYRAAEIAAKYKLMVDFHGTYKPTGLNRTYPNVINYEAVHGLEQMKWSDIHTDQVTYDVTMPFIRMLAGPVDYTQGAMHNANKRCYHSSMDTPMSQGTRCRQLAEYVVFESPLNMLCDSPTNYDREEECTEFIATIPTVWEQTIAMNGEIGKYITMARRKGDVWYVGSLTNWDARTLTLDLSFLGAGRWKAEMFHDGVNANRLASDYQKTVTDIPASRKLTVKMAQGGGCALKIYKE